MGTTINLANIALGFDVSKIQKGVDLSAAEIRKLSTSFQNSISGIDRYNAAMEIVDKARKAGALTTQRVVEIEASLAAKYGLETEAMRAAAKATEDLARAKAREVEIARQQAADLATGVRLRNQVATAEEKNAAAAREYAAALRKGIIDLQTYNRLLEQMQKPQKPQSNNMLGDVKSTLAQYAGMAAAFRGVQASMSLAATAESNKIALEVLTGSVQKASFLFDGFIALDRSSPLSRQDFSRAAQTLVGYGVAAESTMPALRALSEVSIGNAERFQSLALAFGQVQANGRLMGQEVLQMVNAGFNPLQEISRTTGTSMAELKKQMEAGAISSDMVADAFKSATSEGGRFFDMNERLKNSAAGQYAKMKSDVELLATEIGTNLLPAAKALMEVLSAGSNSKGQGGLLPGIATGFSSFIEATLATAQDAFTNLDENSYGTKLEEFLTRIGRENGEAYMESIRHVLTPAEQAIREKNMAARADTERKEMQRIAAKEKAELDALTFYQKEQQALQRQLDILQLGSAEVEFQENLKKGLSEQQAQELRDLQEKLETEKKVTEDLEKRQKQDAETKRRVGDAQKDLDNLKSDVNKKQDDNPNNIAAAVAPALRAGSVEAYRFLMNQRNEAAEIAREQADIAQQQLLIMEQTLNATQTMQVIGVAGRTA
jgi:tape measure domain-containing protein